MGATYWVNTEEGTNARLTPTAGRTGNVGAANQSQLTLVKVLKNAFY